MPVKNLSLKDLFRFAFSEPVIWLAGEKQAQAVVGWVASSIEEAQAGDLLLSEKIDVDQAWLAKVQHQGVAAVLFFGSGKLPKVQGQTDLMIAAAPELQMDIRHLHQLMLSILINQRAALIERGVRIHAQLLQMAAEGEGLGALARAMAELSSRGVIIQDKRGRILAEYPSSTLLTIWGDVVYQLNSLEPLPELMKDRKKAAAQIKIETQEIPGGLERLVTPIVVGQMARGYLSLVGIKGELDDLDWLVSEQGRFVCAIEMARKKAVREAEKRLKGDLLSALLQDTLSPRDARLWVEQMGLDLNQAHVALRFAWDASGSPTARRLETMINGEIARLNLRVISSNMGNEVICFCQVPADIKKPEPALALASAVYAQSGQEFPGTPLYCGIGTIAKSIDDWRTTLRRSGQALEMARRLQGRLGVYKPLYYADLSVYRLLLQLEHSPELVAYEQEMLGKLLASDNSAELLHTLETYFEHNGNLAQTAEALFVHRNTLIYRMDRIASITGLELDQPEPRLALQLALRIYRMSGSKTA